MKIENLTLSFGNQDIFKDINLNISDNSRRKWCRKNNFF